MLSGNITKGKYLMPLLTCSPKAKPENWQAQLQPPHLEPQRLKQALQMRLLRWRAAECHCCQTEQNPRSHLHRLLVQEETV